jgi:phosphoserine phosphatase
LFVKIHRIEITMNMNGNLLKHAADNTAETVASDLEGTLSAGTTWEGMRDYLIEQGQEQSYKRFFLRQMPRYGLFKLGLLSREVMKEKWIVGQLRLFAGYTVDEMAEMGRWVVEKTVWPGRRQLVVDELLAHRAQGRRVIINTGQFEPVLAPLLLKMAGVEGIGTPLAYEDGLFNGQLGAALNTGPRKAERLEPFLRDGRILAAYGDTAEDLPMMILSREPVAVYPDDGLRREAESRGWRILEGNGS